MTTQDRMVWENVRAHLRASHAPICRHWFGELEPLGLHNGAFGLRAQSAVHRDYLRRECLDAFNDALSVVTGQLVGVRFVGPGENWEGRGESRGESRGENRGENRGEARHDAQHDAPAPADAEHANADAPASRIELKPVPSEPGADHSRAGASDTPRLGHSGPSTGRGEPRASEASPAPRGDSLSFERARRATPVSRGASGRSPFGTPGIGSERVGSERHSPGRPDRLAISPDHDFESFIVGPNNQLAHAASVAVAQQPGKAYNPIFIYGGVGLGKTHLLQAICLEISQRHPEAVIHYISCDAFVTSFMEAVESGGYSTFRHEFRDVDVLVIDDIHFLGGRERTQDEFFHTFNALHQAGKQVVLSSDAAPDVIPDLEDRLVSRFKWGLVAEIEPPTFETRAMIVRSKARLRGLSVPDDVCAHVAQAVTTNIRELEGAILKLQAHADLARAPITLELARRVIGQVNPEPVAAPSIELIIQAVSDYYHVKRTEVLGKRRHKSVSLPRQMCMYLARHHTRHSLEEIGGHFGGRDHTTVMHAVRAVGSRREADPALEAAVNDIEARLRRAGAASDR